MKKIIISGLGGQGIKFCSILLGKILSSLKYKTSLIISYDAAMSGGEIQTNIIYNKNEIENLFFETPDLIILFSKKDLEKISRNKKILKIYEIEVPEKFKKIKNIFYLGILLKKLGLDINKIDLDKILREENKEAIKSGYNNANQTQPQ